MVSKKSKTSVAKKKQAAASSSTQTPDAGSSSSSPPNGTAKSPNLSVPNGPSSGLGKPSRNKTPTTTLAAPSSSVHTKNTTPEVKPTEDDPLKRAEKVKEQGNVAFKAARYGDAIDLYTEAIDMNPQEPSYLTNRAATYMALKRFRPALTDCQQAMSILSPGSSSPSTSSSAKTPALVKTLLRLARCQFAVGEAAAALSSLSRILALEAGNTQAIQLKQKIITLQGHVKNFEVAKEKRDWAMARLALDKCMQAIEGEGGDVPGEWRVWKVEMELCRSNWDAAGIAANDALRLSPNSPDALTLRGLVLFLTGKLPQSLQHLQTALRFDPGHEPAQKLRKRVRDVERLKEEGNMVFKKGQLQDAIDKYSAALDRIGDKVEEGGGGQIRATLLSNRATTLLKLDRHEEALADTDGSLLLSPNSFKALRTRARIHLLMESYDAAVGDFKSAIQQAETEGSATDADIRALRVELKKAEAALKRSKTKDYYKILGVGRDCNEIEIKKAYRKESLIHHPDKGGDEEKFKLVVEAHAVLSDPHRRQLYDMGDDEDGSSPDFGGMGGVGMGGGMSHTDLANMFAQFHGGGFAYGGDMHSHGF